MDYLLFQNPTFRKWNCKKCLSSLFSKNCSFRTWIGYAPVWSQSEDGPSCSSFGGFSCHCFKCCLCPLKGPKRLISCFNFGTLVTIAEVCNSTLLLPPNPTIILFLFFPSFYFKKYFEDESSFTDVGRTARKRELSVGSTKMLLDFQLIIMAAQCSVSTWQQRPCGGLELISNFCKWAF